MTKMSQGAPLYTKYPRARGSIVALCCAAEGKQALAISAEKVEVGPVSKRATRCKLVVEAISDMVQQQMHPLFPHAAWTIIHRSCAHAFDYDARLVGAARLEPVVGHVCKAIEELVAAMAGGLDEDARAQLKLLGSEGGCGLRFACLAPHAHAAYWAATSINEKRFLQLQLQWERPKKEQLLSNHRWTQQSQGSEQMA